MRKNPSSKTVRRSIPVSWGRSAQRKPPAPPKPKKLSRTRQREAVKEARILVARLWPQLDGLSLCLYLAVALQLLLLKRHRVVTLLQAGTAFWQRNSLEGYGFEWDGGEAEAVPFRDGVLLSRDVHVWLAIEEPATLIDPTTRDWPAHAHKEDGREWTARKPPPFLWETAERFMTKWDSPPLYRAIPDAIRWAVAASQREIVPMIAEAIGLELKQ